MDARSPYPSDLTDLQWALVCNLLTTATGKGRPIKYPRREVANAVLFVARTGCRWRELPPCFPPWRSAYWYFTRWKKDGTLPRLLWQLDPAPGDRVGA